MKKTFALGWDFFSVLCSWMLDFIWPINTTPMFSWFFKTNKNQKNPTPCCNTKKPEFVLWITSVWFKKGTLICCSTRDISIAALRTSDFSWMWLLHTRKKLISLWHNCKSQIKLFLDVLLGPITGSEKDYSNTFS